MRSFGKFVALGIAAPLALSLFGCPGPPPEKPNSTNTTVTTKPGDSTPTTKPFKAALVFDLGGKDDQSFNASANAGLEKAQQELNLGPEGIKTVESKSPADYKTHLTNFANQNYNVIIAVGFAMADAVKEVSAAYPNIHFAIIDADAPEGSKNVAGLRFQEEQGSLLAGYLAAKMSKKGKIGFVGGMKIPLIEKFEAGYRAGAQTAGFDPTKQVIASYVGDWDDMSKATIQAKQQFDQGADIIFQAAGKGGLGVIKEAARRGPGYYAIGVDSDQDSVEQGRVLTSMVKHVDTAVFDTIKDAQAGKFVAGSHIFSMKDGGIGLSDMKYTKQDIPADVLDKLAKLSKMISDGTVKPPTTIAELASFKAPAL